MENNLPRGWIEVSPSLISEKIRGVSYNKNEVSNTKAKGILPVFRANNINDGKLNYEDLVYVPESNISNTQRLRVGDVVIAMSSGSKSVVGKAAQLIENWEGSFGAFCGVLRPNQNIDAKYFGYYFQSKEYRTLVSESAGGTNINNLKNEHFEAIKIPLPPLAEQQRIVAKLDALMARMNNSKARLERIPVILKNFRQAVLAAAVSGELTKEWREENGVNEEWKEDDLNSIIPKGGIFDGPFGSNLKTSDYVDQGIRVIRLENIEHLHFVNEKETYITEEKYQTLTRHAVGEGDIIFSSFIADEIRACILPKQSVKAIAKADCFCIRPDEKRIDKRFLIYSLVSSNSYRQLAMNVHGATRPRINTTQLKELRIFLPPLEEQQAIVRKVEALFHFADSIEARYQKAKAWFDKLPQSLLAKAFRGELVPQDEDDEPASVLLERIKQAKQQPAKTKTSGKRLKLYEAIDEMSRVAEE